MCRKAIRGSQSGLQIASQQDPFKVSALKRFLSHIITAQQLWSLNINQEGIIYRTCSPCWSGARMECGALGELSFSTNQEINCDDFG